MNVHVKPVNDLAEHPDEGCPCNPSCEAVAVADSQVGTVTVHHSFDGREAEEERARA